MTDTVASSDRTGGAAARRLVGVLLVGGAVAVALGVYGKAHDPTHEQPYTLFFSSTIQLKVWFATAAGVALAVVQLLLGLRLYDKMSVPRHVPAWLGDAHRLVGTLAFVVTLPVAYQCLWALGFQSTDTRVLVHSLLGCFFYGIFTVKVLAVRVRGLPAPTLPLAGGLVFAALVGVWLTERALVLHLTTTRDPGVLMFHRFVNTVEVLAVVAVAVAVVLLFAHEPDSGSGTTAPSTPGARVFAANSASCHGDQGAGGGTGPQLAGGVAVKRFPNVDDQVTFVTDGSGAMPSFGGQLSPAEIREVVEYTRTL